MIDLEQFHRDWTFNSGVAPQIEALVAELRAARKVVALSRNHYEMTHAPGGASYPLPGLGQALAAYDRAVQ